MPTSPSSLQKITPDVAPLISQIDALAVEPRENIENILRKISVYYVGFAHGYAGIKPLLGKVIDHVQRNEMWQDWGYKSFNHFMSEGMEDHYRVGRTAAYACWRLVQNWPTISAREANEIGTAKLYELSRVTREGETSAGKWLKKAKDLSVDEFKHEVANATSTTVEGEKLCREGLLIKKETRDDWRRFKKWVMEDIGSESETDFAEAIMGECRSGGIGQPR